MDRVERVLVDVDRDSVAMGDDMMSHAYQTSFVSGMRLKHVLRHTAPEIHSRGWSWVAVVDGVVSAVWSVNRGVQLLVENRHLFAESSPLQVYFRYFLQMDPKWLYGRLAAGAPADREALNADFAPIAAERAEREQRRRERRVKQKLLSAECVAALVPFGATIDLHSDTLCRFFLHGEQWRVEKSDSMTVVTRGNIRWSIASLRPRSFAEVWLLTAIGACARQQHNLPALPDVPLNEAPPLKPGLSFAEELQQWSGSGPGDDQFAVQLAGDDAVSWYHFAVGRTFEEVFTALKYWQ